MIYLLTDVNGIVQGASVILLLVLCCVWIIRRIIRKRTGGKTDGCCDPGTGNSECSKNDSCAGCPLTDHCKKN